MDATPVLSRLDRKYTWTAAGSVVVPAVGASVVAYKQGATVRSAIQFATYGVVKAIPVFHSGSVKKLGQMTYITATTSWAIYVDDVIQTVGGADIYAHISAGALPLNIAGNDRLLANDVAEQAIIYPDPLGLGAPDLYITVGQDGRARSASGRIGGYIKELRYDVCYPGPAGQDPRLLIDLLGGWVMRT